MASEGIQNLSSITWKMMQSEDYLPRIDEFLIDLEGKKSTVDNFRPTLQALANC